GNWADCPPDFKFLPCDLLPFPASVKHMNLIGAHREAPTQPHSLPCLTMIHTCWSGLPWPCCRHCGSQRHVLHESRREGNRPSSTAEAWPHQIPGPAPPSPLVDMPATLTLFSADRWPH